MTFIYLLILHVSKGHAKFTFKAFQINSIEVREQSFHSFPQLTFKAYSPTHLNIDLEALVSEH